MPKSNPWASLSSASDASKVTARRVTAHHPLDLFWARDVHGTLLLVVQNVVIPEGDSVPRLRGIGVASFPESCELRLSLDMPAEWELFATLCEDLVETTRLCATSADALTTLISRLERWQRLMAKDKRGLLSESEIRGLIGELTFLHDELVPRFGVEAVDFWNGPVGAAQDFAVGMTTFEIKSHSMTDRDTVRISSPEQLWPVAGDLFLVTYVVAVVPSGTSGRSLLGLVNDLRGVFTGSVAADTFEERLVEAGFLDLPDYGTAYGIDGPTVFEVRDGFPRLANDQIPAGVCRVSYDVRLERCRPFRCELPRAKMVPKNDNRGIL